MGPFDWQLVLVKLGLLLGFALLAGGVSEYLRVPKETAYLLVGIGMGPGILGWITAEHVELFTPLTRLAIALVLFNLGCRFPLTRIRRIFRRVLRLSAGELSGTFLLVAGGLVPLLIFAGVRIEAALLLGALALPTSPATTILMLKETESEGPVTEYTTSLVALNNLVSIVLFELVFLALVFWREGSGPSYADVGKLVQDLGGSVALGVAGGLVTAYAYTLVGAGHRLVLLMAIITLLLGVSESAGMYYLLTFLTMGFTVANISDQTRPVLAELDRLTGLLCVVFFVTSGAGFHVDALERAAGGPFGLVALAYILFRFLGKYFGVRLAASRQHEGPPVRHWLGTSLVAQTGAAVALARIAVDRTEGLSASLHQLCLDVQTVIFGTVIVFELLGPILIRQAVLRAGEVPLVRAIRHTTGGVLDPLRTVWNRLLLAAGRNPWKNRPAEELKVRELMRKSVVGLPQEATFHEVIAHIEQSRDNTYPVVGRGGELVGVIRYHELSSSLFDPSLGALVRAADVTTPAAWILHPNDSLSRAYERFQATKDDCLPVITDKEPYQLIGLVRRRDVLRWLIRSQTDSRAIVDSTAD
jgi:Kef-type K+ transport system membrane component KefB